MSSCFVQSEDMELLLRSSITCNASKSFTCAQSISKVKIHTDIDVYIFVPTSDNMWCNLDSEGKSCTVQVHH